MLSTEQCMFSVCSRYLYCLALRTKAGSGNCINDITCCRYLLMLLWSWIRSVTTRRLAELIILQHSVWNEMQQCAKVFCSRSAFYFICDLRKPVAGNYSYM